VPRWILLVGASALLAMLAIGGYVGYLMLVPAAAHQVILPASINGYVKQPPSASAPATALRNKIVSAARGEVSRVVAAVYERSTGPGTSSGPQVIVFIGGNLSGGNFISDFMATMRGSVSVNAGSLHGQAACAPGSRGGPAECAWADNDTFGVLVSATLTVQGLAQELQQMRPLVEHPVR